MNRERKLSVIGGRASKYVTLKKPSQIIPFKGKFPLVEPYQEQAYYDAIQSTDNLEDLSKEFQEATEKGKQYLAGFNLTPSEFLKMSNSDKSDKLMNWLERDCIDFSQLTIK